MKTNGDGAKKRLEVLARKAVKLIYELSQDERVRIQVPVWKCLSSVLKLRATRTITEFTRPCWN